MTVRGRPRVNMTMDVRKAGALQQGDVAENGLWRSFGDDAPLGEHEAMVRNVRDDVEIMGGHDHRAA